VVAELLPLVHKILGPGIISSFAETDFSLSEKSTHLTYNVELMMNRSYKNDQIQDTYYVVDSFK
jgi:phenylalanine-4-hydroxylase